jgi:uncharacterized membrane protein
MPESLRQVVEMAATGVEVLAVAVIVVTIAVATAAYLMRLLAQRLEADAYRDYRHLVARALLLGLELLVAADVVRTVALEPTRENVLILALLVVIRTLLSWGLVVEIEQRWPWQSRGTKEVSSV